MFAFDDADPGLLRVNQRKGRWRVSFAPLQYFLMHTVTVGRYGR